MSHTDPSIEQLYETLRPKVQGYLYHRVRNPDDAQELTQQVFLKVCAHWASFDASRASLSTWVYTITRNTLTDYLRKQHRFTDLEAIQEQMEELPDEDALEALAVVLEKLDKRERDLIVLHYYEGYTLKQIGAHLSLSYPQIKRLHQRALARLRTLLAH